MAPQVDARAAVARLRAQFALPFTAAPSAAATAAAPTAPVADGQEGAAAAETRRGIGSGADVEGGRCNEQGPRAGAAAGKADTQGGQPRPGAAGEACGAGVGSGNPFSALVRDGRGAMSDGGGNAEAGVLRPCAFTGKVYVCILYMNVKHRTCRSMSGVEDTFLCSKKLHERHLFGVYVPAMAKPRIKRETVNVVLALDRTAL